MNALDALLSRFPKAELDELVETRRDLHRHPELGFAEKRTAGVVASRLRAAGLSPREGVGKTGVTADAGGGGPRILVRADMDALPLKEETGAPYASEAPGRMHACGHDGHVAMGLAVAQRVAANPPAPLRFLFQPAEEGQGGARACADDGVLEGVRAAFGIHLWAPYPAGRIGVNRGPLMAAVDQFEITVEGRGGHGAAPHETEDSILAAARIVDALQSVVAREISPLEPAVVTIGSIHGGTAFNIIPGSVRMEGTARSFSEAVGRALPEKVRRIVEGTAAACGVRATLRYVRVNSATVNDPKMADLVIETASRLLGEENVETDARTLGGEDMSVFLEKVPGCFFFVGCGLEGPLRAHHSPRFDIDERALAVGTVVMEAVLREAAKRVSPEDGLRRDNRRSMSSAAALLALGVYLAAVLAIGAAWRRRAGRDEVSFFVADRSLNTFWGFLGLASLTTGGSTTIALAALVYTHGISGLWLDLAGVLGLLVLGLFFARRVRREAAVTLPEILGRYYGEPARRVAAVLVLASEIVWFALLTEATQVVLTAAFGLAPVRAIVISTAVFVAYTSLGGQYAVVRTDLLQYGLMVVGIPGVALACALSRAHGLGGLPAAVWSFPTSPTFTAGDALAMLVLVGLPHVVGSDVYLKLSSCRDEAVARRSALFAAGSKALFGLSVAAIALAARKALPPAAPEGALPAAVLGFAPPALAALVLVALVATMQTSADIVLLSASAVTARDLAPALRGGRPLPIPFARLLPVVYGALGLVTALALDRDVLRTLRLGYSIFAAGLILPTLVALAPARFHVPTRAAIAAMVAGGAAAVAGRFVPELSGGRDPVLIGTGVNAAVLVAAYLLRGSSRARRGIPG